MSHSKTPNNLVNSSSPYLKQHAYNPVNWYPWGEAALQKAKDEDKPMIISIGYSACHWCHVMERESFENEEIARVMNEGFVCVKVDREERPDVDQIYMEAIQIMGLGGGWPLNVFTMPDQKPFYGGTYFPPKKWLLVLKNIDQAYNQQRNQLEESAREFSRSLSISDTEKYGLSDQGFSANTDALKQMMRAMTRHMDPEEGGIQRAPKFPNPSIWKFLLIANAAIRDKEIHDQIMLTLRKMAGGGIYDQIGGGFARYSVDERWFAPHFEKMLYDNGQLISLYAMAYQVEQDERFKQVVYESVGFVKRELTSQEFGFYSALDADSEGEEGNYYIWSESELDKLLGDDAALIKSFYHTESRGNWERGSNILYTTQTTEEFAKKNGISPEHFKSLLQSAKSALLAVRQKREKPGLDHKVLTGWNVLMTKGLIDAYHAFGELAFIDLAEKNALFIEKNLLHHGRLLRSLPNDAQAIPGYLDDYAFTIDAYLSLYQANFQRKWLNLAIDLTNYTIEHFYDTAEEFFFYTDDQSEKLIARKKEIFDNVIPASNSAMANNLYILSQLVENRSYLDISRNMISKISQMLAKESQYLTNWGTLYALMSAPTAEIAVIGDDFLSITQSLQRQFLPNKIMVADHKSNDLPLLQHRHAIDGKTTIYVCFDKSCKLPVHAVGDALKQLKTST